MPIITDFGIVTMIFSSGMLKLIVSKCVRNENSIATDGNIQSCTLKQKGLGPLKIGIYQTDPN